MSAIEYGIREDWGFVRGDEIIMPAGRDYELARLVGETLADAKGKPHSIVYRRVGDEVWSENNPAANRRASDEHRSETRKGHLVSYDDKQVRELIAAAKDMQRAGEHDGECVNYEGATAPYDEFDSCSRHIAAYDARKARLEAAIEAIEAA